MQPKKKDKKYAQSLEFAREKTRMKVQNREINFMISIKCTFLISCWHNVRVFCRKSYYSIFFREIVIWKSGGGKF